MNMPANARAAAAKSLQSCLTLCDPIDGSPPDSPVPGILQARTLEWVAISFSNAWNWKGKVKSRSRVRLFTTPWTANYQAPSSMGFSRQECWIQFLDWEDPLKKEMAVHSSIPAWEIPWTEEPGRLWLMGSQRVGHNLAIKQQHRHLGQTKCSLDCLASGYRHCSCGAMVELFS